jgi:hypothetical protein
MPWHKKPRSHSADTFVLTAEVSSDGVHSFERIPVRIPNPPNMRPTPVLGNEKERMEKYFLELDLMCQDDEIVAQVWRDRAFNRVENIVFNLMQQENTTFSWRQKFVHSIEKFLGLQKQNKVDIDQIIGGTLTTLLLSPENEAWISEVKKEIKARWDIIKTLPDPYHRPSYRLSHRNTKNSK